MENEKLWKQMLRAFNKDNHRWAFDGREFYTEFYCQQQGVRFRTIFRQNAERLRISVRIHEILDRFPREEIPADVGEFYGDNRFEEGFEWLADIATKRADELREQVLKASGHYCMYKYEAETAARRIMRT